MLDYFQDALACVDYLVARAENALFDVDGNFHVAEQAFDVGVDDDIGFCYGFEMGVKQARLSFFVDEGYESYRLKSAGAGKGDYIGMVLDSFLYEKCIGVV